tara:strand:- start:2770 stop:4350 length:1581 start_codon:yes stop_codon:yes gene_type:complete
MADPKIRIKRSAVPGKKPTAGQLPLGELGLNTFDAELFVRRERTGLGTDIVPVGMGATVTNILYVTADGNDNNTGKKLGDAKATIAGAVGIATDGTVIRVSAGDYTESNPIKLPPQVSIIGDSLREVTVRPNDASEDLFHVAPGNYITEMSFNGTLNAGKACFAFDPDTIRTSTQSPYIRNCTNFIPDSIGMKIDGDVVDGDFNSMVTDSFTQYNQGGIGVSITNDGYAQIVSLFTICTDVGIYCATGGQCDITNSNSSFGNFGLVADGVSNTYSAGIVTTAADAGSTSFDIAGLGTVRPYDGQVIYFDELYYELKSVTITNQGSGYVEPPTITIASAGESWGIDASVRAEITGGKVTTVDIISNGRGYNTTSPSVSVSAPPSGTTAEVTIEMVAKYYEIKSATKPHAGISTITIKEELPFSVGVGETAPVFRQSRILASSHAFEYIGSGVTIATALPQTGGVTITANEVDMRNGGSVIYTSTDQAGNFRIGDGVTINQAEGTITGNAYQKSVLNNVTPLILALGG